MNAQEFLDALRIVAQGLAAMATGQLEAPQIENASPKEPEQTKSVKADEPEPVTDLETVRGLLADVARAKGAKTIKALLADVGAKSLRETSAQDRGKLYEQAQQLLAGDHA